MKLIWPLARTTVKLGIMGGALKLTVDYDIWSLQPEKGAALYREVKQYIFPGTIFYPKQLPSCEEVRDKVGRRWNRAVDRFFSAVSKAPSSLRHACIDS
ncbi:hypothetical protein AB6A40_003521 [Gnathostoma spinigerum]|uniref:MICOS complex subunit MIC13 n=1 Tax=Gnathostoma spinigerum TaxID=75299 RepID=A0ABD6EC25_9BILA